MKVIILIYAFILIIYLNPLNLFHLQNRNDIGNNQNVNKTTLSLISKEEDILRNEFLNYINNFSGSDKKLNNQIHFDTNLTQRFKEIERINYRFKNSI